MSLPSRARRTDPPANLPTRSPVEPLEARRFLASAGLAGHVLTVTGSFTAANAITVGLSADLLSVVVRIDWYVGQGNQTQVHHYAQSFPVTATIRAVHIAGGNDPDRITIDQTYAPFPIATTITGAGGNDTIRGGDEPDVIYGRGGDDLIYGGAGDDTLYGDAGNDTLIGGDGNDSISGEGGRDWLEGDDGNDTLRDPLGPDTVYGGGGNNTFQIHSLALDKANDYYSVKDTLQIIAIPTPPAASSTSLLGSLFPITSLL